jgi:ATP-binding cassette subfamily B protein
MNPSLQSAAVFSIRNLEFRYSDAPNPAIQRFSIEIASGARIGITGAVGSGKTTFLQILAGNERLFQGEVLLHGRDIRSYSHEELSAIIALVEQRPFLFAETIRRNVLLNRAASDAEVHRFLEAAGLADDVARLPRGLETPLGEWGVNLSGGQKQRLTIARALAKNPQILLLDDCLSAVDVVTEEKILANLDRLLPNTTIIWVAHRLSTLRLCFPIVRFGT